jgi:hypothetical protein
MITKNIFGISTLVLSAFFFYVVNILAFVNQPPWHIKAVIIAVFSIPAVVFLLLGAFFRGFSQARPAGASTPPTLST